MPHHFEVALLAYHDCVPSLGYGVGEIGGAWAAHAASVVSLAVVHRVAVHADFCRSYAPFAAVCDDPFLHRCVHSLTSVVHVQCPHDLDFLC